MVDRRVRVILEANAGPLAAGFRHAKREVDGFSNSVRTNRAAWDDLSSKAIIGGAAIAGGLGLAAKAAIDWESAWAGVTKTVDGSSAQMAELEGGLRNLAKELPATHEEIAGVAEAAGQLGVARNDILDFTETAIALGESTNLSAEEAATSLAQFSNIMGTVAREGSVGYEKLGSTLVALGNDGASTEKQIMDMALRLAGAGQQIGATEADILAMANALSSVGIEAQLGGGAMSRAMLQMNSAVIGGGEELEKFAQVAGMSASEFAAKWRSDPIAATNEFIGGLGRIGASGGDAAGALEGVGLAGTQNAQVLLRAAGASDLMTQSLKLGASAWDENAALQEEAQKRYATTESRMKIARNTFKDAAIDLGSVLGPALATVAEKAAGLANAFVQLPGPVKNSATAIAGVAASALLIGGATVKAIGWTQDLRDTLDQIGIRTGPRTDRALRGVAKAATGLAVFAGARIAIGSLQDAFDETVPSAKQLSLALDNLGKTGNLDEINEGIERLDVKKSSASAVSINDMGEAVAYLSNQSATDKTRDWMQGLVGMDSDVDRLTQFVSGLDQELTSVFEQDPERARQMWSVMVEETKRAGGSVKDLEAQFPLLTAAMDNASATGLNGELSGVQQSAEEAEQATEELTDAITSLGDTLLGQRGSAREYQQTLSELKNTIAENGATLDISTQAGRDNEAALDALAESTQDYAAAVFESTGSIEEAEGVLSRGRTQWEKYALAAGMPKDEVKALADELFTLPDDVTMAFKTTGAGEAKDSAAQLGVALGGVSRSASGAKGNVLDLDTSIKTLDGKTVTVEEAGADASQIRVRNLDGSLIGLPNKKSVQVQEIGSTAAGEMVVQFKDKVYAIPASKTAQIRESGSTNAKAKVLGFNDSIRLLNGKTVKVGEDGAQNATGRVRTLDGSIFGLKGKTVQVEEIGSNAAGDRVVRFKGKIYEVPTSRTSDVSARVHGLWDVGALVGQIGNVRSKTVTVRAVVRGVKKIGSMGFADGGFYEPERYADGGMRSIGSQPPQIRPAGGKGILWAEQGAGPWESFISGHPAKAERSKAIWLETGKRLGMVEAHADGAMRVSQRHYVAPQPRVTVPAPPAQQAAPVGASAAQVEAAISRAFSGVKITTSINGRDFKGVMERTNRDREGR